MTKQEGWHAGNSFAWWTDMTSYLFFVKALIKYLIKATERRMVLFGFIVWGYSHHGLDGIGPTWQKDHWIAFTDRKHGWKLLLSPTSCFCYLAFVQHRIADHREVMLTLQVNCHTKMETVWKLPQMCSWKVRLHFESWTWPPCMASRWEPY